MQDFKAGEVAGARMTSWRAVLIGGLVLFGMLAGIVWWLNDAIARSS